MKARAVAIVALPGVQLLDVSGPLDVFAEANAQSGRCRYQLMVIAAEPGPVRSSSGVRLMPDRVIGVDAELELDTLLIAGCPNAAEVPADGSVVAWLRRRASAARRFGSVCSGAFFLAEAGLLDGRRVTTHWAVAEELARRYPSVSVDEDAIHVSDGALRTSAGVTAGLDLALALVEEDLGQEIAMKVAGQLVMFFKRPGGQMQFSRKGEAAPAGRAALQGLQRWVAANPALAAQASLDHVTRVTALGELTASIAHEVNQPLAAIVTYGDAGLRWLDREIPELDEARNAIEKMIDCANLAGGVIARLRALSKKKTPEKTRLDINEVVNEVLSLIRGEVSQHQVSVRLDLAAPPPAVFGDRVQLQQVILNLLVNGIQAMAGVNDRPRELLIRSRAQNSEQVLVEVRDSGVGVSPDHISQLFNAFFTTKADGVGMGLSICRSIIEVHGGRIWASQNDGPGATFHFTLPAHCAVAAQP
jgi:transcriptional regulator GlxA family with amidase domain